MEIYWTKIKEIIEETPEIKTFHLECPEGVTWEEGAHIQKVLMQVRNRIVRLFVTCRFRQFKKKRRLALRLV